MDIFALRPSSSKHYFITEARYFEKTQRRPPWSTHTKSIPHKPLFLATCPDCKNAIEIRELDRPHQQNGRTVQPYGRHYTLSVPDLDITYSQEAYDNCSLRGEESLSSDRPRGNKAFSDSILMMIVEHAAVIREVMATTLGFSVGKTLFESLIRKFVTETRYQCKGVIPSNIPFAIIYWCESQVMVGQAVRDANSELASAITNNSEHFYLKGKQIYSHHKRKLEEADTSPSARHGWGPHRLAFYMGRRVHNGNEQIGEPNHMTLNITEHTDNKPSGTRIFTHKITYSNLHFANAINKFAKRLESPEEAEATKNKQIESGKIAFKYIAPLLPADWRPTWADEVNLAP